MDYKDVIISYIDVIIGFSNVMLDVSNATVHISDKIIDYIDVIIGYSNVTWDDRNVTDLVSVLSHSTSVNRPGIVIIGHRDAFIDQIISSLTAVDISIVTVGVTYAIEGVNETFQYLTSYDVVNMNVDIEWTQLIQTLGSLMLAQFWTMLESTMVIASSTS